MPNRRTRDVIHVAMTDHLIQQRVPAGDLLAARPERDPKQYRGPVVPCYPASGDALPGARGDAEGAEREFEAA